MIVQHYTKTGKPPTKAEMRAILHANADREVDAWSEWFDAHPES